MYKISVIVPVYNSEKYLRPEMYMLALKYETLFDGNRCLIAPKLEYYVNFINE